MVKRLRLMFCLVLIICGVAAQDFRATLTGLVTDPSGAAIPGATVKVTNASTNSFKEAKTTSLGNFTIPYLEPGVYNVEVGAPGFQTMVREKIVLRVADKVNLPVELKIGQTTESVVVTASQDVIETASADRGLVFDPIKTQQLPLNGRQTYQLMALTPGVLFTQEAFGPGGHSGSRSTRRGHRRPMPRSVPRAGPPSARTAQTAEPAIAAHTDCRQIPAD